MQVKARKYPCEDVLFAVIKGEAESSQIVQLIRGERCPTSVKMNTEERRDADKPILFDVAVRVLAQYCIRIILGSDCDIDEVQPVYGVSIEKISELHGKGRCVPEFELVDR